MKKIISMLFATILVLGFTSSANAAKTLKCQTVLNTKADEVKMLKDFTDTVTELTSGSLKFEILPAGAVVGVKETLDAVDKGLIDCGFAWTHYCQVITLLLCYLVRQLLVVELVSTT